MSSKRNAEYWIDKLKLWPHPGHETGYLNEVFRDDHKISAVENQDQKRNCATHIYFLHKPAETPLTDETVFFRMKNNELLHFYEGHPVTLYMLEDPNDLTKVSIVTLGPDFEKDQKYFFAIKRGLWFVRRLESKDKEAFSLIGCSVTPGYDDQDIETATWAQVKSGTTK